MSSASWLVVAENLSAFVNRCFFALSRRDSGGGAADPAVGGVGGVGVVTPVPVSDAVGPPVPVLSVPVLGPVLVGVKVELIVQDTPVVVRVDSNGGQLLVWENSPETLGAGAKVTGIPVSWQKLIKKALHLTVNVCACAGLVVLTCRLPKSTVFGARVTTALALLAVTASSATVKPNDRKLRPTILRLISPLPLSRSS
jgi:hypothetical protein